MASTDVLGFDKGTAAQGLALEFAEVARALQAQPGRQGTLQTVCDLAVPLLNASDAAITVVGSGGFTTIATTSEVPNLVDRIQYETNEGPCLDAMREHEVFCSGDLTNEARWPLFAQQAYDKTGIQSMLAHRLFVNEGTLGALNIYSTERDAFTEHHRVIGAVFAAHAAIAVQAAEEHERAENLEVALTTSRRIGTAMGILMGEGKIDEDEAFRRLRHRSQETNRKLVAVAADVVRQGTL
jgi:GAF domain-containing protein